MIRLVGSQSGKLDAPTLPHLVTTGGLQLWGSVAAAPSIKTASLVLFGPAKEATSTIQTAPIRLWGLP
jgi:hypothetical protein